MSATIVKPGMAAGVADLRLGAAANLLFGVKPVWTGTAEGLFEPAVVPTQTTDPSIDPVDVPWGFPIVSLHPDAESLLSTLYDYRVAPAAGDQGDFSVTAGPLAVGDGDAADALEAAGHAIGLNLTQGLSYMLVRLRRSVGSATSPAIGSFGDQNREDYLTADARDAYAQLPTGAAVTSGDLLLDMKLTADEAAQYVQALYRFGTHFVSSIEAGDVIFQVFGYPGDRFAQLQKAFDQDKDADGQVTGITALDYQYYTTPVGSDAHYGYVSEYGTVTALSGDPALADTIGAGDWQDERYAGAASVFQAYSAQNTVGRFLTQFDAVAPIAIGLTPLADLVPDVFQAKVLARLFNGALLQKYGAGVTVPFTKLRDYQWSSLFPSTGDTWLSTIATPTIDVYQDLVDLGSVQMINTEAVESFTVASFALLVDGAAPIDLPGTNVTLASYILDTSGSASVPTVRLGADAFDALKISIGEMYGALTLATSDGSKRDVLLDGFRFATGDADPTTGRTTVSLRGDVLSPPDADTLAALTTDLQFSVVSAEALMWSRGANQAQIRELTVGYLDWLTGLVPDDCEDVDLVALTAQAQYIAKAALNLGGYGTPVPYLTFDSFQPYVASMVTVADDLADTVRDYQTQIAAAKQAELTAKTAEELNANIKATGALLTKYFGVLADNQQDTASYYGSITDQKRQEFSKTVTNIVALQASLKDQQKAVNQAVIDFQQAVADWETEQILKLCFTVATDVFTLGVGIAVPSTEINAVKSLGETAQKIQKVFTVLNALSKLETDLETSIRSLRGAETALSQLDHSLDMPTTLEWQEFTINMKASLAAVPGDLAGPKAELIAAFDILSLRGQALVAAKGKQAQLLTDIYFNERQKAINAKMAARLDTLKGALHLGDTRAPDLPSIDLIGLTGQVQAQLKQVLAALAKTLALQDAAVQYTYLGAPTPIQKFDLSSLKQVMMQQQQSIIHALTQLNPPPIPVDDPIEYRVAGVPVSALTGGSVYDFAIQPSATEFWKYAMVRVDKVLVSIDGITGSGGGEYLATLSFIGDPFDDRDASRNPLEFNTVQRNFGPYDYDIATGKPKFGDQTGATDAKITRVTPFGTWQVSLPPLSTNKGIAFEGTTVDIVLTFDITALLVDTPARPMLRAVMPELAADVPTDQSLANLLDNMYNNQAVLKGWDVVFNVLEDPVNAFLAKQYKADHQSGGMTVDVGFCQGPFPTPDQRYFASFTKLEVVLGGPLLQFQQNNHDFVTVTQAILSGFIQTGSMYVPEDWDPTKSCNIDDPGISWGAQKAIDVSQSPYVEGSVALGQVQGLVQPAIPGSTTHSVVLDFADGSFVAKNLTVNTDDAQLNLELTDWFVTHEIQYIINTIDFSDITTLPALQPSKFMLNVLTTNADGGSSPRNILQQFVTTSGVQQSNLTINVNQPIPDGSDCSLMINTKIMFEDIFVESFNKGSTNIMVAAIDPGTDFTAWSAQVSSGTVTGSVNFANDGDTQYRINSSGNTVVWDISGLQFLRTQQMAVQLNYTTTKNQYFEARQQSCGQYGCSWSDWDGHSVDVNVVMTGAYPIAIQNSGAFAGKNQTIQLQSSPPTVDVSNTALRPTGACECNDNTLKVAVLNELAKDVPGALEAQLAGITFSPISIFALQNLLFPGGTMITMDQAFVPGDLVVIGHFTDDPGA